MKCKKTIIISLALVVFYCIMYASRSTSFGYMAALLYESNYSTHLRYECRKQENERNAPGEFRFAPNAGLIDVEIIPCLLYYRSHCPERIDIAYRISDDLAGCQYLDFTRLELVLKNGRRESLLPPNLPFRLYLKDCGNIGSRCLYEAGKLKDPNGQRGFPQGTEFRLSGRPPEKQVTLIAEGMLHRDTGEDQPFRQVSVWQLLITDRIVRTFGKTWFLPTW